MAYSSELLCSIPGISHGFLNVKESACFDRGQFAEINQVHGNELVFFKSKLPHRPNADAAFTDKNNLGLGVITADCLPLLMASSDGKCICVAHGGWKGIASGIIQKCILEFEKNNINPEDICVSIGPHIGSCCYEVSSDFHANLLKTSISHIVNQNEYLLFHSTLSEGSKVYFDLSMCGKLVLESMGVKDEHIDIINTCTYCSGKDLGSYRRRSHIPEAKTYQCSWILKRSGV
ncbi:peptidoglycan editing factor PgeF [Citrobacter portucalensis]|uniref:peptidoglycan editing factor PgeF n=1 Tax=Citrobacter portucalensis TaxID=1639133 RepID=UPI00339C3DF4